MRLKRILALILVFIMMIPTSIVHAYLTNGADFGASLKNITGEELPATVDLNSTGRYEVTVRIWESGLPYHNPDLIYEIVGGNTETVFMQGDKLIIGAQTPTRTVTVRVIEPDEFFVAHTFSIIQVEASAVPTEPSRLSALAIQDPDEIAVTLADVGGAIQNHYSFMVPYEVDTLLVTLYKKSTNDIINVAGHTYDVKDSDESVLADLDVKEGHNTWTITIKEQGKLESTITIAAFRGPNPSSQLSGDNSVSHLEVIGYELEYTEPVFFTQVEADEASVNIIANFHESASADISLGALLLGELTSGIPYYVVTPSEYNNIIIKVTAENGDIATYTIVVHRPSPNTGADKDELWEVLQEADQLISVSPVGTLEGQYPASAKLALIAERNWAHDTFNDMEAIQIEVDRAVVNLRAAMNTFKGLVNGPQAPSSNDADTLKSLQVMGLELVPEFNPETTYYTVSVPQEMTSVNVAAAWNDGATAELFMHNISRGQLQQNQPHSLFLMWGLHDVRIEVTAENNSKKVYNLEIARLYVPTLNKTALINKIIEAQTLYQNAEVGHNVGQYPEPAFNTFAEAIDAAVDVRDSAGVQGQLDSATTNLGIAMTAFQNAIITALPQPTPQLVNDIVSLGTKLIGDSIWDVIIIDLVEAKTQVNFQKVLTRTLVEEPVNVVDYLIGQSAGPFFIAGDFADTWISQPTEQRYVVVGLYNDDNQLVGYNVMLFTPKPPTEQVDKAALFEALQEADSLIFNSEIREGTEVGRYPVGSKNILHSVAYASSLVWENGEATQEEVHSATTVLVEAIAAFKASVITAQQEPTLRNYNNLTILIPINGILNPGFHPNVTTYTVNVAYNIPFFGVNVSTMNGAAISINGEERVSIILDLVEGVNTINVVVTAENGEEKTYTITITRAPAPVVIVPSDNNSEGSSSGGSTGGAGGSAGGSNPPTTPQPTPQATKQPEIKITDGLSTVKTGEGTVKAEGHEIKKVMDAGKPVVLESTLATIDFGKNGLKVAEVTNNITATLELGAKITEESKTKAVLENANLEKAGLEALGGKVLDLIAQLNYSNGTSTRIRSFAEPVKVSINLKELGLEGKTENLTAVRFVPQADGTYKPIKLGGTYNAQTGNFEFFTDSFSLYSIVRADNIRKITLTVNSHDYKVDQEVKNTDAAPLIEDSRTLVPLRVIGEALGAKVDWNNAARTVTIKLENQVLTLNIDELIEGMDVPARLLNSRTMAPLRYVSEKLGAYVMWFGETQTIEIIK